MAKESFSEQQLRDKGYEYNDATKQWERKFTKEESKAITGIDNLQVIGKPPLTLVNNKRTQTLELRPVVKPRHQLDEEEIKIDKPKKRKKKRKTKYTFHDSCELHADLKGCTITMTGLPPGANTLLRKHFRYRADLLEAYILRLKAIHPMTFKSGDKVYINYLRHTCDTYMDWDNFFSSFKIPGDALVGAGILIDDSPLYVFPLTGDQYHCDSRGEERISIDIRYAQV